MLKSLLPWFLDPSLIFGSLWWFCQWLGVWLLLQNVQSWVLDVAIYIVIWPDRLVLVWWFYSIPFWWQNWLPLERWCLVGRLLVILNVAGEVILETINFFLGDDRGGDIMCRCARLNNSWCIVPSDLHVCELCCIDLSFCGGVGWDSWHPLALLLLHPLCIVICCFFLLMLFDHPLYMLLNCYMLEDVAELLQCIFMTWKMCCCYGCDVFDGII